MARGAHMGVIVVAGSCARIIWAKPHSGSFMVVTKTRIQDTHTTSDASTIPCVIAHFLVTSPGHACTAEFFTCQMEEYRLNHPCHRCSRCYHLGWSSSSYRRFTPAISTKVETMVYLHDEHTCWNSGKNCRSERQSHSRGYSSGCPIVRD